MKCNGKWIVDSGKRKKVFSSQISLYRLSTIGYLLILFISSFSGFAFAQQQVRDSLSVLRNSRDSLLKIDSIEMAFEEADERRFERTRQLATQRMMEMTDDTVPEVLRLSGYVPKDDVGKTKLTFTIKSGKKTMFEDSWLTKGYFDPADHLPDSVKLRRLRTIVTIFFSNENFSIVDSNDFDEMLGTVSQAEIAPHSEAARELFEHPRVMYSVFHSRDYWYGIVWDPKKEKFVKVWRN